MSDPWRITLYGVMIEEMMVDYNDPLTNIIREEDEAGLNDEDLPTYTVTTHTRIHLIKRKTKETSK